MIVIFATAHERLQMNAPADIVKVLASAPDGTHGYKSFTLGAFSFRRD